MNRLLKAAAHGSLARRLVAPTSQRRGTPLRGEPAPKSLLARAFSYPQGAGFIGPGAERLLRTVLVEALTRSTETVDVIMARPDLDELLGGALSELPLARFPSVLHVTETLEGAIEHLEGRAARISATGRVELSPTLWVATPGADADVVHQTLKQRPESELIGLFNGPWPYGPTHFIDINGPRRLPSQGFNLLSCDQAIARLDARGSR